MSNLDKKIIFLLLLVLAFTNFFLFGFNHGVPDGDAIDYILYGKNLALGNGYSMDGGAFNAMREPMYPFFLFFIFKLFGVENLLAVRIFQTILLALTAFFVYLGFELYGRKKIGLIAATLTTVIPIYGHYADLLYSENFFTFLLVLCFYLTLRLFKKEEAGALSYGIAGAVFALMALTRMHTIFMIFLIGAGLFWIGRRSIKNIAVFYLVFFLLVGGWASYVHYKTGVFTVTQGRQETHLYNRAVRSELSYRESIYYLYSWIRRSALGGEDNEFTGKYDLRPLSLQFESILMKPEYSLGRIRAESIATILNNPGHYLFGNVVEWVKLVWIEHLYPPVSPFLTRYIRLIFYVLLYGLFFFGSVRFLRYRQQTLQPVFWIASVFLLYNWIIVSFVDAFPRFNMPYLVFYLVIGVAGVARVKQT